MNQHVTIVGKGDMFFRVTGARETARGYPKFSSWGHTLELINAQPVVHVPILAHNLEYITKDHIAMHTILNKLKMTSFFSFLVV